MNHCKQFVNCLTNKTKWCSLSQPIYRSLASEKSSKSSKASGKDQINVTGLSSKVVDVPQGDVGPGASKAGKYKNPEYFCYHVTSYFDAEIEMANFRLPQPSAKVPLKK